MGVWKTPGAMPITLILYFPRSLAMGSTMPLTAPFVAEQMTCPRCPSNPATLLTTMMTPLSPSTSGCSDIIFAANLDTLKVPITLILSSLSISSVEATPFEKMIVPIVTTPAQWTTADTFPNVFFVNSNSAFTFSSFVTSTLKKGVFSSLLKSSPRSAFMSAMTTFAPRLRSNLTVASPRPEEPPVTTATKLPSIFISIKYLLCMASQSIHVINNSSHILSHPPYHSFIRLQCSLLQVIFPQIASPSPHSSHSWREQSRLQGRPPPKNCQGSNLSPRKQPERPPPFQRASRSPTGLNQGQSLSGKFGSTRKALSC